jgi:hypothetical protein
MRGDPEMLEYFMKRTGEDFSTLNSKLDKITDRVDALWGWKYTIMGMVAGVSSVMSVMVTLIVLYLKAV